MKSIIKFFDRIEDKIRTALSRFPILYGLLGGIGIVLFWRGVWHTADLIPGFSGPLSFAAGVVLLLLIGVFVSSFIGDQIIISGLKHEKKMVEETESEIKTEEDILKEIDKHLESLEKKIDKK